MFTFPDAVSKILFQHPTSKEFQFVTQVMRFVGGEEQRYAIASGLRRWDVKPILVADAVWNQLDTFFELVNGTANPFSFTDPWEGTTYPVCFFEQDQLTLEAVGQGRNSVAFAILEGRAEA